jgi:hypothetical protein
MPDQMFTYDIENPLVIMCINSGSWGRVMVVWLDIETLVIGKVSPKSGGKKGWTGGVRVVGAAGFWGSYVCFGTVILL